MQRARAERKRTVQAIESTSDIADAEAKEQRRTQVYGAMALGATRNVNSFAWTETNTAINIDYPSREWYSYGASQPSTTGARTVLISKESQDWFDELSVVERELLLGTPCDH